MSHFSQHPTQAVLWQGFPGAVDARILYTLTGDNTVIVDVEATADGLTPIDVAPAPAFNLDGAGSGDVLEHTAQVQAYAPPADAGHSSRALGGEGWLLLALFQAAAEAVTQIMLAWRP